MDGVAGALAAQQAGADRVELCSALSEGGLTPSIGLIETVRAESTIDVNVLIRPRGGDFTYSRHEIRTMLRDIEVAAGLGIHGVVVGVLTVDGDVDVAVCRELMSAAGGLSVTFHRAFDMTRRPLEALEAVVDLGVDRVLTSGRESSALQGAPLIAELVAAAAGRVIVMAGGGITEHNVAQVRRLAGVDEVHFSARTTVDRSVQYDNPRVAMSTHRTTSCQAIAAIIAHGENVVRQS